MRSGKGARPPQKILVFDLKMEHFGAVFKLDLMEENCVRTQNTTCRLQEEAVASSCRILATPVAIDLVTYRHLAVNC